MEKLKSYWWIAISGSACSANLTFPAPAVSCSPRPEWLIGFPTREEAAETQQFFLNAPIEEVYSRQKDLLKRAKTDLKIIRVLDPEPPSPAGMSWLCGHSQEAAEYLNSSMEDN